MEKITRRYWGSFLAFISCIIFVTSGEVSVQAAGIYEGTPDRVQAMNFCGGNVYQSSALADIILAENARQDTGKEENSTNLQLYAQSAVLMDADSGRILFGKNEIDLLLVNQ